MVTVTFPDGSTKQYDKNTTLLKIVTDISKGLAEETVVAKFNGELKDLSHEIQEDGEVSFLKFEDEEAKQVFWHSTAHLMMQAIQRIFPEAKPTIGPPIENGFYYDIDHEPFDKEDLEAIEEEMKTIVEEDLAIEREEISIDEAKDLFEDNEYKQEILEDIEAFEGAEAEEGTVSIYRQGEFVDLCRGPHVQSTGVLKHFKLTKMSGAYWRGDEERKQLQRIYGISFPEEKQLEEYLERLEKARERDHRKIGKELDLFSITKNTGPGLPLYHPKGKTILEELQRFVREQNDKHGYDYVETPHLFKTDLWKESGHYDNYHDDMFLLNVGDDEYGLKPMNCPGHATIFKQGTWSYRDLPKKYAEDGKVYRKEQRGELSGLSRVWSFTIDDGHLFVRSDQIKEEINTIIEQIRETLKTFGLDVNFFLATKPEKHMGGDEIWEKSETALKEVLEEKGIDYELEEGDGAFYGPKIDVGFEDSLGRNWDGPTVQLDFNMPENFDLTYTTQENEEKRPVMIHRALYGSYERLFMVLIEQYNGAFPLWLSPVQVKVLSLADRNNDYAKEISSELGDAGLRVDTDLRSERMSKKIHDAETEKVNYVLVVGDDEEENQTVNVRSREKGVVGEKQLSTFKQDVLEEYKERR